jgi:hypothetical protein
VKQSEAKKVKQKMNKLLKNLSESGAANKKRKAMPDDETLIGAIARDAAVSEQTMPGSSTTQIVSTDATEYQPVAPISSGDKASLCAVPKARMCNGERPKGVLLQWTYAHSHSLLYVLGRMAKLDEQSPLSFSADGMRMELYDGQAMVITLHIPRSSFARFSDPLRGRLDVTLSSKELDELKSATNANYSLTFVYDDRGDASAPLDLMLCPRMQDDKHRTLLHSCAALDRERGEELQIEADYQFRVYVPRSIASDISLQSQSSSTIVLGLAQDSFEVGSISKLPPHAVARRCVYNARHMTPLEAEQPGAVAVVIAGGECVIVDRRIAGSDSPVAALPLSDYREFRARGALLAAVCQIASMATCTSASFDFGLQIDGASTRNCPLHITLGLHETGPAPFSVEYWVAEYDERAV